MQAILSFFAPTLTLIAVQLVTLMLGYTVVKYVDWNRHSLELFKRAGRWSREKGQRLWRWVAKREERVSRIIDGIALAFFLFGVFTLGSDVDELASLAPELISTSIAIAVLDRLFNYRSEQREKRRVISQMGATDSNDVARAALAVARLKGGYAMGN